MAPIQPLIVDLQRIVTTRMAQHRPGGNPNLQSPGSEEAKKVIGKLQNGPVSSRIKQLQSDRFENRKNLSSTSTTAQVDTPTRGLSRSGTASTSTAIQKTSDPSLAEQDAYMRKVAEALSHLKKIPNWENEIPSAAYVDNLVTLYHALRD